MMLQGIANKRELSLLLLVAVVVALLKIDRRLVESFNGRVEHSETTEGTIKLVELTKPQTPSKSPLAPQIPEKVKRHAESTNYSDGIDEKESGRQPINVSLEVLEPSKGVMTNDSNLDLSPALRKVPSPENKDVHVWVHIPKTGGLAAFQMFHKKIEEQNHTIYPYGAFSWNSRGCEGTQKTNTFGGTHCSASELRDCFRRTKRFNRIKKPGESILYFYTTIRDPADRVLSEYYYWRDRPYTKIWTESMRANRMNLTAWVLDETNVAHNRQATYMLMDLGFPADSECIHMMGDRLYNWTLQHYGSTRNLNKSALAINGNATVAVEELLKQYEFVAIFDELEASKAAFEHLFGIEPAVSVRQDHQSGKEDISDELREMIRERNKLDIQLYQEAVNHIYSILNYSSSQQS